MNTNHSVYKFGFKMGRAGKTIPYPAASFGVFAPLYLRRPSRRRERPRPRSVEGPASCPRRLGLLSSALRGEPL